MDGLAYLEVESFEDNSFDLLMKDIPYRVGRSQGVVDIALVNTGEPLLETKWVYDSGFESSRDADLRRDKFNFAFEELGLEWDYYPHRPVSDEHVSRNVLENPEDCRGRVYTEDGDYSRQRLKELEAVFGGDIVHSYEHLRVSGI